MLATILKNHSSFKPIIQFDWHSEHYIKLDLTANNSDLHLFDLSNTPQFNNYVFGKMAENIALVSVGGYNENRFIYQRSSHFQREESPRCIHLGVDIWVKADTEVFLPLDGKIKYIQNNDNFGDYGPTIIVEHELDSFVFYSLYGHLSLASLNMVKIGQQINAGQCIAQIGDFPVNGDWPPHLHFQLIIDLEGNIGDYPGVCTLENRNKYLANCPDPNLILRIPDL
jgi:murein DD-endopeptidase MepM/ murein hydrolase activator NlpD